MLEKLIVKNIALIGYAELEFSKGLNILSGETGAGKSVLLDSINFALGAKADKSMIRYGEKECSVSAIFSVSENSEVRQELNDLDIEADDELILNRKFKDDGRGEIRVNGVPVNASMLRKITSKLVDVHGQSEHFYLLSEAHQLEVIDRYAGEKVTALKEELRKLVSERKVLQESLRALGGDEAERGRRLDILKYQLEEIDRAELKENEEDELQARKLVLVNIEKIMQALNSACEFFSGDGAANDCLSGARRSLGEISSFSDEYSKYYERAESLLFEAEDLAESLHSSVDGLTYDESEAEEVENRLDLIKSLKKKYGTTISDIFNYREKIEKEFELLQNCDEESAKLSEKLRKNSDKTVTVCRELTSLRKKAADEFCKKVSRELTTLNIKNANFCAQFDDYNDSFAEKSGTIGADSMRFMFSANAGEPLKPLSKVISGGEMSRLMLAIKTQMSGLNEIGTYIFDEIDAGISGITAKVVAEKFADISVGCQIIAVSHLAQIAAMADTNFLIFKQEEEGKTLTKIQPLSEEDKRAELVRLLGGERHSTAAESLASELIASSEQYKNH